ncbi:putative membrane-anchored protein [Rheinheimera pacifica]|uniref:hypothetical protein n=1 Tax=Rheinheimera pacifica TaxID=173990 RepID=UPI00216960D0|nr:hypothetical protein [Rheinheimera pacifica]MCS4309656.1 putative membrane-anchored protein [Rheinheimera pacifica]
MIIKYMKPTGGWKEFERHEELENFLWDALKLREKNEGEWAYMSFTSSSSIWELVIDDEDLATVMLEYKSDETVEALSIAICRDSLLSSNYIKPVIEGLNDCFNINFVE